MTFEILSRFLQKETKVNTETLRSFLATQHAADIAQFLNEYDVSLDWSVLSLLNLKRQAEVFSYLDRGRQTDLARCAPPNQFVAVFTAMDPDDRVDLFNALSEDEQKALLPALSQVERDDLQHLAAYKEGTAGAIMTSDYAALSPYLSVQQALNKLRRKAFNKESVNRIYILDDDHKLLGSVSLQALIFAAPTTPLQHIMVPETYAVHVDEKQENVAGKIARYDEPALPVIDAEGRIVGIVTHDDALDVITEAATKDFHKAGSIGALAESIERAPIALLYRARVFWLVLLVFGNIFSGAGIVHFEALISAHMGLLFFLPLLIASGGNAGSQASTLTVRAMATGEVQLKHWGHLLSREVLVAGLLGLTMAAAIYGISAWRGGLDIALVVSVAMMIIVLVGSLIGLALPFVLTRIGLDPATASGPLVTSLADIAGVLIYFSTAQAFLF